MSKIWKEFRRRKLNELKVALNEGKVDEWIIPILNTVNSHLAYVTLSSCAGRLVVMDMPDFGNKKESIFLGKWHDLENLNFSDFLNCVFSGKRTTWVMLHPPILHVACFSIKYAEKLIRVANDSGIRRSGIISTKRMVVEICCQERIEFPVRINGEVLSFSSSDLKKILDIAKSKLSRSRQKFERFKHLFINDLNP